MLPPYYFLDNMPYTNFHNLNLDWILHIVKTFEDEYQGVSDALDAAIDEIHTQEGISVRAGRYRSRVLVRCGRRPG